MSKETKSVVLAEKAPETTEKTSETEESIEQKLEEIEKSTEEMPEEKLPFPRAAVVNRMRLYLDNGKQIKGQVKDEMNIWLGKMLSLGEIHWAPVFSQRVSK